jgi:hypothetical protein
MALANLLEMAVDAKRIIVAYTMILTANAVYTRDSSRGSAAASI